MDPIRSEDEYKQTFPEKVRAEALKYALDIRKFEIDLYWKRTTYFWTLLTAAFAAFFALCSAKGLSSALVFLVSCIGVVLSVGWYLVNRGSKYWQENWERHVDLLETEVIGPLHKTTISREESSWVRFWRDYPYSVSKINQLTSLFISLVWIGLCASSFPGVSPAPFLRELGRWGLLLGTAVFVLLLLTLGRTGSQGAPRRVNFNLSSLGSTSGQSGGSSGASAWAWILLAFLEGLVAVQAILATATGFLTVSQMHRRGLEFGLPFIWHFGMWGDLLIVSPLVAYLVGRHLARWRVPSIFSSIVVGGAISGLMSWTYTFGHVPEAHVLNHRLTGVGWVHFVYMAVALAVILQVLLFTRGVTRGLLGVADVCLIVHVLLGTHMALGILNAISPLGWYPGDPLRSVLGWSVVVIVALTLIARTFWFHDGDRSGAAVLVKEIKYWLLIDWSSVEGFLRALDWLSKWLAGTYFLGVIFSRLHRSPEFANGEWGALFATNGLQLFLIAIFGLKYFLSRHSARKELSIAPMLFPRNRMPDDWSAKKRALVLLAVLCFLALYLGLATYVDSIKIVSLLMFLVACNDVHTRQVINTDMRRYLADQRYKPSRDDPEYDAIETRRSIVSEHLFDLPYLAKEKACAAGCGIAFIVAIASGDSKLGHVAASVILIVTLVVNEVITQLWRFDRDRRLDAVPHVVA
jgi:hypothetical protein